MLTKKLKTLSKALNESDSTEDVIKALKTGINEDFDINKLRYHKIILFSDAD